MKKSFDNVILGNNYLAALATLISFKKKNDSYLLIKDDLQLPNYYTNYLTELDVQAIRGVLLGYQLNMNDFYRNVNIVYSSNCIQYLRGSNLDQNIWEFLRTFVQDNPDQLFEFHKEILNSYKIYFKDKKAMFEKRSNILIWQDIFGSVKKHLRDCKKQKGLFDLLECYPESYTLYDFQKRLFELIAPIYKISEQEFLGALIKTLNSSGITVRNAKVQAYQFDKAKLRRLSINSFYGVITAKNWLFFGDSIKEKRISPQIDNVVAEIFSAQVRLPEPESKILMNRDTFLGTNFNYDQADFSRVQHLVGNDFFIELPIHNIHENLNTILDSKFFIDLLNTIFLREFGNIPNYEVVKQFQETSQLSFRGQVHADSSPPLAMLSETSHKICRNTAYWGARTLERGTLADAITRIWDVM